MSFSHDKCAMTNGRTRTWALPRYTCAYSVLTLNTNTNTAERCSRIIAKPPSESAVKAWFYNLTNSLQQIRNDEGAFPALFPCRILTLVSNCRNLRSASPSFSKDGCTHTVKSVLRLTKRPNNVTPRISAHEIHFCHTKTQQNDSCIKS